MAIKRWNASTSQWELVGTPGTATPSAIGAATLASTGNTFLGVQTITAGAEWPLISRFTNPTSTHRNHILLQRSSNNAAVTSGFSLGGIAMSGHDGTNYGFGWNGGAEITAYASQTWTPSARGTSLAFSTTPDNTTAITERMRINSNGTSVFGGVVTGTAPSSAKVYVNNGSNENIGNATWGGSLVINEYSNTLNANMGIEFKTRADSNGSGWRISSLANNPDFIFELRSSSATWTEIMRIGSDGKVDIKNTANPTLRLIENTGVGNPTIQLLDISNASSPSEGLEIKYESGTGNSYIKNMFPGGHLIFQSGGANERMRILGSGAVVIGHTAALNNEAFGVRTNVNIQGIWLDSTDANYATVGFGNRVTRANTSAYTFLQNWSSGGTDVEHYMRGDGQAYADGSWNGGGADYAEYFEWQDGNSNNEDRRGYSVSLINDKIKIAEEGDIVFGVVSGNPSVVGDDAPMKWTGKYLKDDFGSYIRDEEGYRVLNPEYDEDAEYISREARQEWSTIGLMGKLRLRKGQAVGTNWIKMKDISEQVEEWLVR